MTIRVLHLIKGLGPGGAENLLLNQARVGDHPDIEFHVAYLVPWKNHLVEPLEAAGWTVHCLDSERGADPRWVARLWRLLAEHRIDVVHGHSPIPASVARVLTRCVRAGRRPRLIYTEHNEWGRHHRTTRFVNRATMRFEDRVIAVSEAVSASMDSSIDVDVLIHGIDIAEVASQRQHRNEVRSELGIAATDIVIGIVANFRREKAYDVLLSAAVDVIGANPRVRFVSVGQGPLETEIQQLHADLGLGDRFQLLGYRDDATRVMSAFDIFTLSSLHEGLPVSLMDAIALGLPIVATDVGGIKAATTGWQAIIVEPGDRRVLSDALLEQANTVDRHGAVAEGHTAGAAALTTGSVGVASECAQRFDARRSAGVLAEHYRSLARHLV